MAGTILFPIADVATTGWSARGVTKAVVNYYDAIDEATSDGDATFIHSTDPLTGTPVVYKCKIANFAGNSPGGVAIVTAKCPTALPATTQPKCHPELTVRVVDGGGAVLGKSEPAFTAGGWTTFYFTFAFPGNTPPADLFMEFSAVMCGSGGNFYCCVTQALLIAL